MPNKRRAMLSHLVTKVRARPDWTLMEIYRLVGGGRAITHLWYDATMMRANHPDIERDDAPTLHALLDMMGPEHSAHTLEVFTLPRDELIHLLEQDAKEG